MVPPLPSIRQRKRVRSCRAFFTGGTVIAGTLGGQRVFYRGSACLNRIVLSQRDFPRLITPQPEPARARFKALRPLRGDTRVSPPFALRAAKAGDPPPACQP